MKCDLSVEEYNKLFEEAYRYGERVVHSITNDTVTKQDLLQEFSVVVLSDREKYQHIIQYKSTVYNILLGLNTNMRRRLKPEYTNDLTKYNHVHTSVDLESKETEYIESILYQVIQPAGGRNGVLSYEKQLRLIQDYKADGEKLTIKAFAKEKNVDRNTMRYILTRGKVNRNHSAFTYKRELQILRAYRQRVEKDPNTTIKSFSVSLGIDPRTVSKLIKNGAKQKRNPSRTRYTNEERIAFCAEFKQRNKPPMTQRAFAKKHGISTATLHKMLTEGPKPVDEPLSIQYFKLHRISGLSYDEIADTFGVSKGSIAQQISKLKKRINQYLAEFDYNEASYQDNEAAYYLDGTSYGASFK